MYIKVLPELSAKNIDNLFTYTVPENIKSEVQIGKRVTVPFGSKTIQGFIIETTNEKPDYNIKDIINIIDETPILNEEMIKLGEFISDKYLCYKSSAYQVMLPTALKAKIKSNINKKYITYISLIKKPEKTTAAQNKIISILENESKVEKSVLSKVSSAALKTLLNNRAVEETKEESYRLNNIYEDYNKLELTNSQRTAVEKVLESKNKSETFLLHGITGSGKTEIYLQIIEEIIKGKKEVIVLVPEISLTEQMINRFVGRFGDEVAILHSALSDGEKYDEWRKIINKEVKIVIGARSAIFAPFTNLGLIIIDEEHEDAYKQENNPKYHARDIALWRSKYHNCPLVLGSATPSLETYARAKQNVYTLLTLDKRIGDALLPKINIVSMKEEYKNKNHSIFSKLLKDLIKEKLKKNEQIILFLNRRGYSSYVNCRECGHVEKCPNCNISLTYHKNKDLLRCHYCGYTKQNISVCPECQSKDITSFGFGTEKIEEEIKKLFNAKVLRMDRDTTTKKGSHKKISDDFRNHKYDILLGTQMIAKGLDFPLVTLVGVLNADTSLNIPDFRSSENTYQLLTQVSGRAGRADKPGEVVVQTFNPDHYSIDLLSNKYEEFYEKEMDIRKKLGYSPYYYMINIKVLSKDYNESLNGAKKIKEILESNKAEQTKILGPTVANIYKLNNYFIFSIIIKHKGDKKLKQNLKEILEHYKTNNKIKIELDIDPIRM